MMTVRDQWRHAALQDQHQIFFRADGTEYRGSTGAYHCAISIVSDLRMLNDLGMRDSCQRHACPEPDCAYMTILVSQLAVHLNNVHRWDWLTLAAKFPPILPEDQA